MKYKLKYNQHNDMTYRRSGAVKLKKINLPLKTATESSSVKRSSDKSFQNVEYILLSHGIYLSFSKAFNLSKFNISKTPDTLFSMFYYLSDSHSSVYPNNSISSNNLQSCFSAGGQRILDTNQRVTCDDYTEVMLNRKCLKTGSLIYKGRII